MSYWTHVNCVVRIDSKNKIENFYEIFGKECLWESSNEVWQDAREHPEDYLPIGSEGSLTLTSRLLTKVNNSNYPYRYRVIISGALRDFMNWYKIQNWINESNDKLSRIHGAVARIELYATCDALGMFSWTHEDYAYKDPFFYKMDEQCVITMNQKLIVD